MSKMETDKMAYNERGVIGVVWRTASLLVRCLLCKHEECFCPRIHIRAPSLGEVNHNFSARKVETGHLGLLTMQFSLTGEF